MKKLTRAFLIVDTAERNADLRYALGLKTPDPVVFLQHGTRRDLVVPQMEKGRALKLETGVTVETPESLGLGKAQRRRLSGWALGLLRKRRIASVSVGADFRIGIARRLERAGIRITVVDSPLLPRRERKTPDEIRRIRETQRAAVAAMRAAIALIRASRCDRRGWLRHGGALLTAEAVRQAINRVLFDYRCIGRETIVAPGNQAVDPHCTGEGPLRAGEAIVIDIFPQHLEHGYWGDLTRTIVKGAPGPKLAAMFRAVKAAQAAALKRLKPGVKSSDVHGAAVREFERRGFRNGMVGATPSGFIHSTGHGVGLEVHEAPSLSVTGWRLREGNVVTVEPGLYYPGVGGIRIEDTVVITASGWRYLVPCEKPFRV